MIAEPILIGYADAKARPFAQLTLNRQFTAKFFDDIAADKQTQPGSFPRGFGAKKGLEYSVQVFLGNSGP
jgi:hypothetical protein